MYTVYVYVERSYHYIKFSEESFLLLPQHGTVDLALNMSMASLVTFCVGMLYRKSTMGITDNIAIKKWRHAGRKTLMFLADKYFEVCMLYKYPYDLYCVRYNERSCTVLHTCMNEVSLLIPRCANPPAHTATVLCVVCYRHNKSISLL